MDRGYILFNTIIYGTIAMIITGFFDFGKILNFALGAYMIMGGYILVNLLHNGITRPNISMILILIGSYFFINWALLKFFPSDKQRDHAGLVITLGVSLFLENITNYIYGPSAVNLSTYSFSTTTLIIIFLSISIIFYLFYKHTFIGTTLRAICENSKVIRGLQINAHKIIQILFGVFLIILVICGFFILQQSSLRAQDGIFYMIKGVGIMILVGLAKKEYIFLGAFLYVLLEYFLFIKLQLPITYKETLVLLVILLVLIFKPEGVFSIRKRLI